MKGCINIKEVKKSNKNMILKLLFSKGEMSRKEIARVTGLTPASVTQQVTELMQDGVVVEMYSQTSMGRAGRKEIIIDLARSKLCSIGVVISKYGSAICVMDFKGTILYDQPLSILNYETASDMAEYIATEIERVSALYQTDAYKLVGAGVSLRGVVNGHDGIWRDTYCLFFQCDIPILKLIQEKVSIPIWVEDNVRAMANAEALLSGFTSSNGMLFVKYGSGIGAAICIHGTVYEGYQYKAAEIGHMMIEAYESDFERKSFEPLESGISYQTVLDRIKARYSREFCPVLYEISEGLAVDIGISQVIQAYEKGDVGVSRVVCDIQNRIAVGIYNAICLFDPNQVVVYGEFFENSIFFNEVASKIKQMGNDSLDCKIVKSAYNQKLEIRGAASLALGGFLE